MSNKYKFDDKLTIFITDLTESQKEDILNLPNRMFQEIEFEESKEYGYNIVLHLAPWFIMLIPKLTNYLDSQGFIRKNGKYEELIKQFKLEVKKLRQLEKDVQEQKTILSKFDSIVDF